MVIGNPNKFSIIVDVIPEWSSDGFVAGLFYISIGGFLFPDNIVNTTLNGELYSFFKNSSSSLLTRPVNVELFGEKKLIAYKKLYSLAFPDFGDDDGNFIENNYLYFCDFKELQNHGCYIFSVSDGKNIRILGAKNSNNKLMEPVNLDENIPEIFMPIAELDDIIFRLKKYYDEFVA